MKPISLEFQAFGPYAGREYIDFKDLSSKGLLLICGDTGSGKTMILDAMTLALYGKASGGVRNDFTAMRCNRCDPDVDTYIEFVFEAKGSVYKFERRLKRKRVNLSESQQIYRMDEDGRFEPIREKLRKTEMPGIAKELIGLDYEQFSQVIILPQGKFEQFLESDSGQKGEILTEIFGTERWNGAARAYYDKVKETHDGLVKVKESVEGTLARENCDGIDDMKQKIEDLRKDLMELERAFEAADRDGKRKQLLADRESAVRISELRKSCDLRRSELEEAVKKNNNSQSSFEESQLHIKEHVAKESEKEQWKKEAAQLESGRKVYENAEKVKETYNQADTAWKKASLNQEKAEKALKESLSKESDALKLYEDADRKHREVLDAFVRGAAGRLASELEEGQKCPVCGSTHHPDPAKADEHSVSSEEVDKRFRKVNESHDAWEKARSFTENAREVAAKAGQTCTEAEKERSLAEKALQDSKAGMFDGISSLKELDKRIKGIQENIRVYENTLNQLTKDAEESKVHLVQAQTSLEKATEEEVKAKGELDSAIEELEEKTGSREEPDLQQIDRALEDIERENSDYQRKHGGLTSGIERLNSLCESLEKDWEQYTGSISEAESALAFAKQLRGDSGIGLKRYVLGIMFDQVVYAANEMLEKVHGGRYSLLRTDESASGARKKGLDLAVIDSFSDTDMMRSAGSLSGGEKFLVSLALSIGLSTIARTDGIHIDAMFIDEGFGSLDERSIGDALEILESIRSDSFGTSSFIGIISHVQLLQDNIPSKLIVHKSRISSTIEYTLG